MTRRALDRPLVFGVVLALLFVLSVMLDAARGRLEPSVAPDSPMFITSGAIAATLAGPFKALAADVYWVRAIQHYGGTRRSTDEHRRYDRLYPLLDITTALDPRFNIAYRFGAIFLAEPYPHGPGRPDLAVALLEKGVRALPHKWQYLQDIGLVHYWSLEDYAAAARWFEKAADVDGAPWWLRTMAATTAARAGNRRASALMWAQIRAQADNDWMRTEADRRIAQLAAMDDLDRLSAIVQDFTYDRGAPPASWDDLVRAGRLPGRPVDPMGAPYLLDPGGAAASLSSGSPLFPLPGRSCRSTSEF